MGFILVYSCTARSSPFLRRLSSGRGDWRALGGWLRWDVDGLGGMAPRKIGESNGRGDLFQFGTENRIITVLSYGTARAPARPHALCGARCCASATLVGPPSSFLTT